MPVSKGLGTIVDSCEDRLLIGGMLLPNIQPNRYKPMHLSTTRTFFSAVLALVSFVVFSGCATIFTGTTDEVRIDSDPPGARIFIDGIERGETPDTIEIKRSGIGNREVTLRLDGYEPYTFVLQKEFNAVSVINLFNPLFWAVDVATGSVTRYSPLGYDMTLEESSGQAMLLKDIQRDEMGRIVLPETAPGQDTLTLEDAEQGLRLVFK